jgi:hypothetical protein
MAKKRRRKPQHQRPPTAQNGQSRGPQGNAKPASEDAIALSLEAMAAAEKLGMPADEAGKASSGVTEASLGQAMADARAAKSTFDRLVAELDLQKSEYERRHDELETERTKLSDMGTGLDAREAELKRNRKTIELSAEEQSKRSEELAELAAAAETGFLARRDEIIGPVRVRITELTAAWHQTEARLIADWDNQLRERTEEFLRKQEALQHDVALERSDLDKQTADLERRARDLDRRETTLEVAQQLIEEDREDLDTERQAIVARASAEGSAARHEAEARVSRLLARNEELEHERSAVIQLTEEFGRNPANIVAEVTDLRDRLKSLEGELALRPDAYVREELDSALQRLSNVEEQRDEALRCQRELEQQVQFQELRVADVERLELINTGRESALAAYESEIKELTARFEQLTADTEREGAFPGCRSLDVQLGSRSRPEVGDVGDLEEFAIDLRFRMAAYHEAARVGKRLNYRPRDVRTFLAGLAMSRLHLLEGVSGTGKTTLPHAFAAAVGGGVKKIEVQAGWRDKQDLLGYYNSFERVYRETPVLQHLYKACLPPFEDRLVFIVLDEMNLSHPEQYFADFLSALEDPKERPLISIADRLLPDVPDKLVADAGVQLPLAPNVWFIGTANQDETTFSFAPKTYDRAHIMELEPHAAPTPDEHVPDARPPVGFTSLQASFARASARHMSESRAATDFVQELLVFFQDRFHVGWGERMDLQIGRFVPVNVAAGGSLGEALDHVVATKVLRKIRGLHTVRKAELGELEKLIDENWPTGEPQPRLIKETIARERRGLDF